MRDNHIINVIESMALVNLGESELTAIRAHVSECLDCRRAFEAAQVSARLLKERAAETFEPSPFFHTRVMARLREQQATNDFWAWGRMWRAAGALASSMVATVVALAVLTFVIPGNQLVSGTPGMSSLSSGYSAEEVILNQSDQLDEQASDGQVLTTIYAAEEDAVR